MGAKNEQTASSTSKALLASRGFRKAPPKLAHIIGLVNLAPAEERLLPLDREWNDNREFRAWAIASDRRTLKRWLRAQLKGLSKEFTRYVSQDDGGWHAIWLFTALHRYNFVRESRKKLREIARAVREAETTQRLPIYLYLRSAGEGMVFIDESWTLRRVTDDEFDVAVFGDEEATVVRYIRECPVCGQIFYAVRKAQFGCGPPKRCGQILRQRKSYGNKPPSKTETVQDAIAKFEDYYQKEFQPTLENIQELSENWADATPKQVKRVSDYLTKKRAETARKR
ncbi:hypothetical protein BH20ACI3_BH20ACI3_41930 [soil metagenome]